MPVEATTRAEYVEAATLVRTLVAALRAEDDPAYLLAIAPVAGDPVALQVALRLAVNVISQDSQKLGKAIRASGGKDRRRG